VAVAEGYPADVLTVGVFAVPPRRTKLASLVLAGLTGWQACRIWALKARRLAIFLIF
jgi:hypothetical protein